MRGLAKWAGTAWVKRTRTPLALSPIKAARLGLDLCAFTPALDRLAAVPRSPLSVDPISHHPTGRDPAPRPLQILRPPARGEHMLGVRSDSLVGAALVRRSRIQRASGVARSDCGW